MLDTDDHWSYNTHFLYQLFIICWVFTLGIIILVTWILRRFIKIRKWSFDTYFNTLSHHVNNLEQPRPNHHEKGVQYYSHSYIFLQCKSRTTVKTLFCHHISYCLYLIPFHVSRIPYSIFETGLQKHYTLPNTQNDTLEPS